jgi:signal transduction histidine kinase
MTERAQRIAWIAALAVVYAGIARLGLALDAVGGFATLVWPPTGIALVALIVRGRWLWPGVAIGAFAVNVWVGAPPLVALGMAAGNTLEAVAGSLVFRRLGGDPRLQRIADVAAIVAIAALSTAISASIGVLSLSAGGVLAGDAGSAWLAWWLGDATGDLVVASLLLAWRPPLDAPRLRRVAEAVAIAVLGTVIAVVVFDSGVSDEEPRRLYLVFPPMIWAAVRFGIRGATLAVLVASAIAIAATATGHGPFVRGPLHRGLLELQGFMAVVSVTMLMLGAAIGERDRARRFALDALRTRDDFLAIASHELRTPLGALVLQLDALTDQLGTRPDGAELAPKLARAERQCDRMTHLIRNLLDVTTLESGQLGIRREPIDLAAVIRDVVDRFAEQAAQAGCKVELRGTANGDVRGAWDRIKLEQVMTNLLTNAFRHAPGAPVAIALESDATTARVTVSDAGPGIAPALVDRVFEPYMRGGRRIEAGGVGIGLYISQRIVAAHGGQLSVRSTPGSGSAFTMLLPRGLV